MFAHINHMAMISPGNPLPGRYYRSLLSPRDRDRDFGPRFVDGCIHPVPCDAAGECVSLTIDIFSN